MYTKSIQDEEEDEENEKKETTPIDCMRDDAMRKINDHSMKIEFI